MPEGGGGQLSVRQDLWHRWARGWCTGVPMLHAEGKAQRHRAAGYPSAFRSLSTIAARNGSLGLHSAGVAPHGRERVTAPAVRICASA